MLLAIKHLIAASSLATTLQLLHVYYMYTDMWNLICVAHGGTTDNNILSMVHVTRDRFATTSILMIADTAHGQPTFVSLVGEVHSRRRRYGKVYRAAALVCQIILAHPLTTISVNFCSSSSLESASMGKSVISEPRLVPAALAPLYDPAAWLLPILISRLSLASYTPKRIGHFAKID